MFRISALSDSHMRHHTFTVPECDLLIHAGDFSFQGEAHAIEAFGLWLNEQNAKHIVVIPGNHELWWEDNWEAGCEILRKACPAVHILNDSGIEIEGIKIWGSPITPFFNDWAWNRARSERLAPWQCGYIKPHWDLIPDDTNILITHGPPQGILDRLQFVDATPKNEWAGCDLLLERVKQIKPDMHFFGHIHAHGGQQHHEDGTSFYNVALCDEMYSPTNGITQVVYEC